MQNGVVTFVDELVFRYSGRHLTDLECEIVVHSFNGLTYAEVVVQIRLSEKHISDIAYRLFALISEASCEPVKKKNFRSFCYRKISVSINSNML